jgi:spermidine synthase
MAPVACASVVLLSLTGLLKPWSPRVMSSGVYVYASRYGNMLDRIEDADIQHGLFKEASPWELWRLAMKQFTLLYYNTGQTATVSVMENQDGVRFLAVDGKTDAGTPRAHDMKAQVLLGQLPLLFHPEPDRVFIVGLGSGVTVGSILTHDVRIVDCAEFSKSVIEATQYFSGVNHHALEDERLRIIPRDARNVLMTSDKDYDVIISQPSNPWISGQSSLFSLEWYRVVKKHLVNGGMFAQWVPAYHMSKRDVRIIIHTLRSVFPHVTAWTSGSAGELILIAKKGKELKISYEEFREKIASSRIHDDISRLGYDPDLLPFWTFTMNEHDISVYLYSDLARPVRKNTDDLLITEFSTPKQIAEQHVVKRFKNSDKLHGDLEALMVILKDVHINEVLELFDCGLEHGENAIDGKPVSRSLNGSLQRRNPAQCFVRNELRARVKNGFAKDRHFDGG